MTVTRNCGRTLFRASQTSGRGIGRVVALLAATSAFLLALAGTSFADESGSISYNGASASVSVALGALGGGASIRATDIEVTKSGCYYIKYKLYVQNGFDDGGNQVDHACDARLLVHREHADDARRARVRGRAPSPRGGGGAHAAPRGGA